MIETTTYRRVVGRFVSGRGRHSVGRGTPEGPSRRRVRRAGRLAGMVTLAGALATAAFAAAGTRAAPAPAVLRLMPNHLAGSATRARGSSPSAPSSSPCWASTNWSGYVVSEATPSGLPCLPGTGVAYSAVSGTWTVPAVTGSRGSSTYSAAWTGIDGFTNSNLIQAGTEQDYYSGKAHYGAWWEILPAAETPITSITVEPGDSITVSIAKVSGTQWSIALTDNGQAGHPAQPTFTTTQTYSGTGASAEWILEAPSVNGRTATLASYGSTVFDKGAVNSTPPGLKAGWGGEMVTASFFRTQVVSMPSAPDTGSPPGDGFAIAYGSQAPGAPTS